MAAIVILALRHDMYMNQVLYGSKPEVCAQDSQ